MTSRPPSWMQKTSALSRPQFWFVFYKIRHVSSITFNWVWICNSPFYVINFWSKWRLEKPLKPKLSWIRKQKVDSDWFWPADQKYVHIKFLWWKTTVKITVKLQQRNIIIISSNSPSIKSLQAIKMKLPSNYHFWILALVVGVLYHHHNWWRHSRHLEWKKRVNCHSHSFDLVFIKFGMWVVLHFTRFWCVIQTSMLSTRSG